MVPDESVAISAPLLSSMTSSVMTDVAVLDSDPVDWPVSVPVVDYAFVWN